MSQEAFIERIAAAVLAGRRKPAARRNRIFGDAYERATRRDIAALAAAVQQLGNRVLKIERHLGLVIHR